MIDLICRRMGPEQNPEWRNPYSMRILWIVAVLVFIAPLSESAAEASPRAVLLAATGLAASCPSVLLIESTNARYYIAVFEAHAPTRSAIDLTLYAKDAVYSLSLPEVSIATPISTENYTYRSTPAVIQNPTSDEFLGATAQPRSAFGGTCPGENIIIPSVASLTAPDRHIDADTDALEAKLAIEAASVTNIGKPLPAAGISNPACADAFADATVDQLVKPLLSDEQRRDPGSLPASVRVQLAATGNVLGVTVESSSGNAAVDAAIVDAARKTTYHPARFACQAERSSHVLYVDFSK